MPRDAFNATILLHNQTSQLFPMLITSYLRILVKTDFIAFVQKWQNIQCGVCVCVCVCVFICLDAVHSQGVKSMSHNLELPQVANQCRSERGWLKLKRAHKMADSSIQMSSSFLCLYCTKSKLSAMAARGNKSSSFSELSPSSYRTWFYLSRRREIELSFWIDLA